MNSVKNLKKLSHGKKNSAIFDEKNLTILHDSNKNITLPGEHNRKNCYFGNRSFEAYGSGRRGARNIPSNKLLPGSGRRFEELAENLYSDYGHHPVEIQATLQMAKELSNDVVLVYQPHQNVRQHEIIDQYTDDIFRDANEIYWR